MITIREAEPKELDTILDFQQKMARETEDLALDRQVVTNGIKAVFEDPSKGTYYVAIDDNDQVIACLLTTPEWSEWRNGTVIWIQSVYVIKNFRGQGVFKMMYLYLKKLIYEDENLKGLRLYVEKENTEAQKVYKALGMKDEHYHFFEWMKDF